VCQYLQKTNWGIIGLQKMEGFSGLRHIGQFSLSQFGGVMLGDKRVKASQTRKVMYKVNLYY